MTYRTNRFQSSSRGSTFTCEICKRRTRLTTQCNDSFCGECEELLGTQNSLWDDGAEYFVKSGLTAHRDALLAKVRKLGGNATAVVAYMPDLFGSGRYNVPKVEA